MNTLPIVHFQFSLAGKNDRIGFTNVDPALVAKLIKINEINKKYNVFIAGALIICKNGTFVNGKHKDIDKDFVLLFTVMDETRSWLLDDNIKEYCSPNFTFPQDEAEFKAFRDSNNMHVINGYIFGNLPGLDMCVGDRVDWHLFGMGSETDLHPSKCLIDLIL